MKTAIVYWSMTSNTETMAKAIKVGAGDNADLFEVSETTAKDISQYDSIALGCPAMGDEVLEESEFEPFFEELLPLLENQKIFLFGSYDWGDGQWMRDWKETCKSKGLNLYNEGFIVNLVPEEKELAELEKIGKTLSE